MSKQDIGTILSQMDSEEAEGESDDEDSYIDEKNELESLDMKAF